MSLMSFALASVVLPPAPGLSFGDFVYDKPMTNCILQMSPDMKAWFDVPDEAITVWLDGSWVIDNAYTHGTAVINKAIVKDIAADGKMFFRVKNNL